MEIFLFILSVCLIGLLFYKEVRYEKILIAILTAKLSEGAEEFQSAISKPVEEEDIKQVVNEIPLEDMSPEEMLGVFQKNK